MFDGRWRYVIAEGPVLGAEIATNCYQLSMYHSLNTVGLLVHVLGRADSLADVHVRYRMELAVNYNNRVSENRRYTAREMFIARHPTDP